MHLVGFITKKFDYSRSKSQIELVCSYTVYVFYIIHATLFPLLFLSQSVEPSTI